MAKQANILLEISDVEFFDCGNGDYVNPTFNDDVEVSDVCIETTVDNTINALINRHHEYCDLKKTQVLRFVNEMMEDEEFEDAIIQAVLKRAAQRTEGSASTIMKAAKQAWNECTRNCW